MLIWDTWFAEKKTGDKPLPQGDNLKAVLFDIDGTIADSDPIHFLAFQEILVEVWWPTHITGSLATLTIARRWLQAFDNLEAHKKFPFSENLRWTQMIQYTQVSNGSQIWLSSKIQSEKN